MAQDTPAAPNGGMTDYFSQLAGVLKLNPDQYHNGSGGGQDMPMAGDDQLGGSPGSAVPPNASVAPPAATAPDSTTAPAEGSPQAATTSPAAAPSGGNAPVSPYTAQDLDVASKLMPQKTEQDKLGAASRLLGAAIYGPQIFNQTEAALQSEDANRRKEAMDTVMLAKDIGEVTKQGFDLQNLAIAAANQQAWAKAANDPNSALTQFTRAATLNALDQTQGVSDQFKQTLKARIPTMSAFDILQNQVLAQLQGVGSINAANVKQSIALADEATKKITANAAAGEAAANQSKANTEARNQSMLEQASGFGSGGGNTVPPATGSGASAGGATAPTNATAAAPAVKKPSKYVVEGKGIALSPAEKTNEEGNAKELQDVRQNAPDIQTTQMHINQALQKAEQLRKSGFTGPIANALSKTGLDPAMADFGSLLKNVQVDYNKAFAKEAGARAGGNVRIEQREAETVGDPSQNIDVVINSLKRLGKSVETRRSYNQQYMDSYKSDPSMENFKFTSPYNTQGWALHQDKKGNKAYVDPSNPKNYEEVQ